jgi:riboflavin biosynthesis pyrimidine reductase
MTLQQLFEAPGLPRQLIPDTLRREYDGDIGLASECVVANFVTSIDGVVALDDCAPSVIADGSEADRFVMALLRALSDAVVIGAGTLRAEPEHVWTPEFVFPGAADSFTTLRTTRGQSVAPCLVVLTNSGELDPSCPALVGGALVITTTAGARRLRRHLPETCTVVDAGPPPRVDPGRALERIRGEGHRILLCEGGPRLLGPLVEAGLVDELFLTVSPVLAGRVHGDGRMGLLEGTALPEECFHTARLVSIRTAGSHLFLRYELTAKDRR